MGMRKFGLAVLSVLLSCSAFAELHGVKGGLVVCIGAETMEDLVLRSLGEAGWKTEGCIFQCLETDPAKISSLRKKIHDAGVYGKVSVDSFDGQQLPYADNLVNLLLVGSDFKIPKSEMERVLVPNGTMRLSSGFPPQADPPEAGKYQIPSFRKAWPSNIDDWTHYLHGADGNAVANDDVVGSPKQLQWVGDPPWSRHHEHMASMNALVSANGKIFFICDVGAKISMLHPPKWKLIARDAFNGLLLWEQPIDEWFNHLQPLKSGPASLPRRLVVDDEHVYVTLGIDAPVSALDATTGKTIQTLEGTGNTQEILLSDGTLFLVRGTSAGTIITAVHSGTGKILWEKQGPVATLTLTADEQKVVYFDGEKAIALNRDNGEELWASDELDPAPVGKNGRKKAKGNKTDAVKHATWISRKAPRVILSDNVVLVAPETSINALSGDSGKLLWSAPHPGSGYMSPKDLLVIGKLVWYGDTAGAPNSGQMVGRDIITGEIKKSFLPDKDMVWLSHHRCHFSKATTNYILTGRMGVEFVDIDKETWQENHWTRGGCLYGVMPCNGLLYTPPHSCACYFETKLNGFSALTSNDRGGRAVEESKRLEKGAIYSDAVMQLSGISNEDDWPVFRHDAARSGSTRSAVPANVERRWSVDIGGKLTQPVTADGKIYVASVDDHTLHMLDFETGERRWRFTAGGRIDSPPSLYRGLVLFGSRDGWVYCLRDSDGELAWRYRAIPRELLIMVYGQLESAWPVHGSVLIENGEVHCVAGRNMFLDGGLRYLRLDPVSGKLISETVMDQEDPFAGGSIQQHDSWLDMTTTLPDVLSSDGRNVYMRSLPFDLKGHRRRINHIPAETEPAHLFSPTGFLDDNWFHRSYWTFARSFPGGWIGHLNAGRYNPSGRLLVQDDSTIYGFGRKPGYYNWTTSLEYRLFATQTPTEPKDIFAYDKFKVAQQEKFPQMKIDKQMGLPSGPRAKLTESYSCIWEDNNPPLPVTGMVGTKDYLFVAGPRDISNEESFFHGNATEAYRQKKPELEKQEYLWTGIEGAILLAVSKKDGRTLGEYKLDTLPVFDGMIAAGGKLFISLQDGSLVCLGRRDER